MEERIRINIVSITAIWLLVNWVAINVLVWRGHLKIGSCENKAVSWDLSSSVKNDDITNNEFPNTDGRVSTNLSSNNSDSVFFNEGLQLNESSVLDPVSYRSNSDK
jgi:hypothetical protein